MNRATLKYVGVGLIICGVVLSTTGIGAFTAIKAERQIFVGVGGKSTSYLGISTSETLVTVNGTNGTNDIQEVGMDTVDCGWQGARWACRSDTTRSRGAGTKVVLGHVTNYFPTELDTIEVTVSETSGPLTVSNLHVENLPLEPGEPANLLATVYCGGASRGAVTITFEARGADTHVTGERTVPITCVNKTSSTPSNPSRLLPSPQQVTIGSA